MVTEKNCIILTDAAGTVSSLPQFLGEHDILQKVHRHCVGIISGLGSLAGADMFFKMVKTRAADNNTQHLDLTIEQHLFNEMDVAGGENATRTPASFTFLT